MSGPPQPAPGDWGSSSSGWSSGSSWVRAHATWIVFAVAVAVRVTAFQFAENKQGDAPMRSLLAERMNADPQAAADPGGFCQFGPLPIELMRPFMAIDPDARRSSRLPSLLAGLAVFAPFFLLARRMGATGSALVVAGLALALGPLHIQVSTTAASEGLYLLFFVAALERLHAALTGRRRRDFVLAGLCGSLAAVTRYDMWLSLPAAGAAALWLGPRDRRAVGDVALFLGTSAILPAAYLGWSGVRTGDPLFFAHFIARDHAALAADVSSRLGPVVARVRQVLIWLLAFASALTPLPFLATFVKVAKVGAARPRLAPATWVVLVAAFAPIGVYVIKGLGLGQFEPLPRFAIAPGAVLLPLAAMELTRSNGARRHPPQVIVAGVVGGAVALAIVIAVLARPGAGRIWAGAESFAALTRLDAEDRALARFLEHHVRPEEGVFIDPFSYADIAIVHAARIPAPHSATLAVTRTPSSTLAATRARTQASWFAAHDSSWGRNPIADWPTESYRFGHWRLAHYGGPVPAPR